MNLNCKFDFKNKTKLKMNCKFDLKTKTKIKIQNGKKSTHRLIHHKVEKKYFLDGLSKIGLYPLYKKSGTDPSPNSDPIQLKNYWLTEMFSSSTFLEDFVLAVIRLPRPNHEVF